MSIRASQARGICALVISQHEIVRRQLVSYLARSPGLTVTGAPYDLDVITTLHPEVVILDLSRLSRRALDDAIEAVGRVGARLIALASMPELAQQEAVTAAGGLYLLKVAGADGLVETVLTATDLPPVHAPATPMPCASAG